jgi:hypothetical protein
VLNTDVFVPEFHENFPGISADHKAMQSNFASGNMTCAVPDEKNALTSPMSSGIFALSSSVDRTVSDQSEISYSLTLAVDLLAQAKVTRMDFEILIDNAGKETNFYPADYEIYLSSDSHSGYTYQRIYNKPGDINDHTDGGNDDDDADDTDVYLNRTYHIFDGEDASQHFRVLVRDTREYGVGFVDYVRLTIYWEAPDLPNLRANYTPSGWDAPLVANNTSSDNNDPPVLYAGVTTYLFMNFYNADFAVPSDKSFGFQFIVDGTGTNLWSKTGALANAPVYYTNQPYTFTAGAHTLCQKVDVLDQVDESNESDNQYCRTLNWVGPPVSPALTSPSDGLTCQATDITLNWNTSAYALSYNVQLDNNADFSSPVIDATMAGTSRYVAGLAENTKYYWRVRGINPAGNGNFSATRSFTTAPASPPPPPLASPNGGAVCQPTSLTLDWSNASGAASYSVQVDNNQDFSSPVVNQSGITSSEYYVSGLSGGTTYYWRVSSSNSCKTSAWSVTGSFTTGDAIAAPSLLSPDDGAGCQSTSLTLSWNSIEGATTYDISVDNNSDFSSPEVSQTDVAATSVSVSGLSAGTSYYWIARARNSCGNYSSWSETRSFETSSAGMTSPLLTTPENHSTGQPLALTLQWSALVNVLGYRFQLDDNDDFSSPLYSEELSDNYTQVSGLLNDIIYYWHVRAKGDCSESEWSETWQFSTKAVIDALSGEEVSGYDLGQNYPNPFTGATVIEVSIPAGDRVIIDFFDLQGRIVDSYAGYYPAGKHAIEISLSDKVKAGVYLYRMKTGDFTDIRYCVFR